MSASNPQPEPKNGRDPVYLFVLNDIKERVDLGESRYGTVLHTFNGRNPKWDLYQEQIDSIFYLRQDILEDESRDNAIHFCIDLLRTTIQIGSEDGLRESAGRVVEILDKIINHDPIT